MTDYHRRIPPEDYDTDLRWWLVPLVLLLLLLAGMLAWPQLQQRQEGLPLQGMQLSSEFPPIAPTGVLPGPAQAASGRGSASLRAASPDDPLDPETSRAPGY